MKLRQHERIDAESLRSHILDLRPSLFQSLQEILLRHHVDGRSSQEQARGDSRSLPTFRWDGRDGSSYFVWSYVIFGEDIQVNVEIR